MEFITLDIEQKDLNAFKKHVDMDGSDAIEKLLQEMVEEELLEDGSDDYGKMVGDVFRDGSRNMIDFIENKFGIKENDKKIIVFYALEYAVIKCKDLDCPLCGAETERFKDGGYGQEWDVHRCLSSNCEFYESDEPDWDNYER